MVELLATGFIPHQGFIVLAVILSFAFLPFPSFLLLLLNVYFFLNPLKADMTKI
jgi:hypothetical protein